MSKITGMKAIVTGGAMGIGLATAKRLLQDGCDVTIWDYNEEALEQAESELNNMNPGHIFVYKCDVSDKNKVYELAAQANKDMGRIDILINNAGIERHGRFCDRPIEEWEREIEINLVSIHYTIHAILPGMYERNSGHIVNISSAAGVIGVASLATYSATKWGVWGLTESLRMEATMDNKKISFSSVHPHFVKEGLFQGSTLNFFGNLLIPKIKTHDIVAKAIVNKALKKNRNTVKIPVTIQIALFFRALVPDFIFQFMSARLFGVGKGMEKWVGQGK